MQFLSTNNKSAPAYKLLGHILENLQQMACAAEAFRQSLDIDPLQSDLVIKGTITIKKY